MSLKIRSIAAILAIALLGAGAVQAWAPPARPVPAPHEEGGVFAALWDWLVSLAGEPELRDEGEPNTVQRKSGCGMDPDGSTNCK
jgi:hypothetical protein